MKNDHSVDNGSLDVQAEKKARSKRPKSVTILAVLVLYIAVFNLARFYQAIQRWFLLEQILPFSPLYLIVTGVIWSLFGLLVFWALWRGIAWAPKITIISTILYNLYFWFDRLLMPSYPQRNANAYFYLIVWSWIFAFTLWVTMSKKNKPFFGGFDG